MARKKYTELYKNYPNKEDFIRALQKIKPDATKKTLLNNWYECRPLREQQRIHNITIKTYYKIYKTSINKEDFIIEVHKIKPNMKREYILKKWGECRRSKVINIEQKYNISEKQKPNNFKMIEFNDIQKYKKPRTREYLQKYGFSQLEINWLEDEGLLDNAVVSKKYSDED